MTSMTRAPAASKRTPLLLYVLVNVLKLVDRFARIQGVLFRFFAVQSATHRNVSCFAGIVHQPKAVFAAVAAGAKLCPSPKNVASVTDHTQVGYIAQS